MLPAESYKWQAVERIAERVAGMYNVKKIRTPVFESADLYLRSIGDSTDIVNKEMYLFTDKGGRNMALRPEGTAGVMRSFIENNLGETLPLKLFYIESLYRYEQPQAGRYREHHQFGAEFFGSELPEFEIELLCMARDFLSEIGFRDLNLHINTIGCAECRAKYNAALRAFLHEHEAEICGDCKRRAQTNPLRALDCKVDKCKALYKSAPRIADYLCDGCKAHHAAVLNGLEQCGIAYECDENLVRGLDYYTRTVFEFCDGKLAVLGGGRYDSLCEQLGGKHMPCVGFGCGIERLIAAADARGIALDKPLPNVFVAATNGAREREEARRLVFELRRAGVSAECDLMGKSLKAQFKYADKQGFMFVATVGESELDSGSYALKRMRDGHAETIRRDNFAKDASELVNAERQGGRHA